MNMQAKAKMPLGTRRHTGQTCPESGVWKADSTPSTTIPLAEGNTFPPYGGKNVDWILIEYA